MIFFFWPIFFLYRNPFAKVHKILFYRNPLARSQIILHKFLIGLYGIVYGFFFF